MKRVHTHPDCRELAKELNLLLLFCFSQFLVNAQTTSSSSVVINEIVTDPQTDWSTNNFNGSNGGGKITQGTDEWIELLIQANNINLTNWSIELIDTSPVTGDLTAKGAFDQSVYVGNGTFTNTQAGDYLILGNVDGSGAMNNSITINLKDDHGILIDAVVLGGDTDEAPSGNSNSIYNESVQRFPNGKDTDNHTADFVLGQASIARFNTGPSVSLEVADTIINEDNDSTLVTVKLSSVSSLPTTVILSTDPAGTASVSDYQLEEDTIIIPAGKTDGNTMLKTINDSINETNETIIITISSVTNGTEAGEQQQCVIIKESVPSISSIMLPNKEIYKARENLDFTVFFNQTINLNTANGTIFLPLMIGSSEVLAYLIKKEDKQLKFRYTIQEGDNDDDGITLGDSLLSNGAILQNSEGINFSRILFNIDKMTKILVDAVAPKILSVSSTTPNGLYGINDEIIITVAFDEKVAITGIPQLNLQIGTDGFPINYTAGTNTNTLNFTYRPHAGDESEDLDYLSNNSLALNNGTIKDIAGNNAQLTLPAPGDTNSLGDNKDIVIQAFPTVDLNIGSLSIVENSGTSSITANLSQCSSQDVVVFLSYSGTATPETDYHMGSNYITIPAGKTSANAAIGITAIPDTEEEGDETIIINISSVSKGFEDGIQQKIITITEDRTPLVCSVLGPVNGTYKAGDHLDFTVIFNQAVTINTQNGTPSLPIIIGTDKRTATLYTPVTNQTNALFRYIIQTNEEDSDGITIGDSIFLNGGTIQNETKQNAHTLLNNVGDTQQIFIDATAPEILSATPIDNSTNVPLSSNIVLTFNDNLSRGTGYIDIKRLNDLSIFEQLPISSTKLFFSSNQLTIIPENTFDKGTSYFIEIDSTAILDDAGNAFAGIRDNTTLNFTTVDIVINEIVTNPQQDWSSSGFDGIAGTGTISQGTDEWLELLIKSDGIDLNGWTLSVIDGTDFEGDLTDTGAFSVINYIGSGSFSDTKSGDYLILGNPKGSNSMNNSRLSIQLKDPGEAIVDAVLIGWKPNEAPSGNASDLYNESVQRYPDGYDSDTNEFDFTTGIASMGSENTGPSVYLSVSDSIITESNNQQTITATLSSSSSQNTTINLQLSGTAALNTDYSISSDRITIPAGSTSGTITLNTIADMWDEEDETIIIDISSVHNGLEAGIQQLVMTIKDETQTPSVSLSVDPDNIPEASGKATITATLSSLSTKTITIHLEYTGEATRGSDYLASEDNITLKAGTLSNTLTIMACQDTLCEGNEAIIVHISEITNGTKDDSQQKTILIIDDDTPTVLHVSVPDGGIYTSGDNLDFRVHFSQAITINTNGGNPYIPLTIGNTTAKAFYHESTPSNPIAVFRYTIQKGDEATNGIQLGDSIITNGAIIKTTNNIDVSPFLHQVESTSNIKIDAVAPAPPSITGIEPDNNIPNDGITNINSLLINGTSESNTSIKVFIDDTWMGTTKTNTFGKWQFNNTSNTFADGNYEVTAIAIDEAGNRSSSSSLFPIKIDTSRPRVAISSTTTDTINQPFIVTFTFSEQINGFTPDNITTNNCTISDLLRINDSVYSATITPLAHGIVTIAIKEGIVIDDAGNTNIAASPYQLTYDSSRPTVAISSHVSNSTNCNFDVTFKFSEDIYNFEISDIIIDNGTASNLKMETSNSAIWTATITPDHEGTVTIGVDENSVTDKAGNKNTAAPQFSVLYDITRPSLEITAEKVNHQSHTFTAIFHFSEAVSDFSINDIFVINGMIKNFSVQNPSIYRADIVNNTNYNDIRTKVEKNSAYDAAGNGNTANMLSVSFDNTPPTVLCQDQTVYLNSSGEITVNAEKTNNGSYDMVSGIATFKLNKCMFHCSDIGLNPVNLTVTDHAGNSATGHLIITVKDSIVLKTRDIVIWLNEKGTASIKPDTIDNGSYCACGIASYQLNQTDFNCNNYGENTVNLTVTNNYGYKKSAKATVTVMSVNQPPSFDALSDLSVSEDSEPVDITVTGIRHGDCDGITQKIQSIQATCSNDHINRFKIAYTPGATTAAITIYLKENAVGKTSISLTATDDGGNDYGGVDSYTSHFTLTILPENDAPLVEGSIDPQYVETGTLFSLSLPPGLFTDPDSEDVLTYSAMNETGQALPDWLLFNSSDGSFYGTPSNSDIGNFMVKLTATDTSGESASLCFEIIVYQSSYSCITGNLYKQSALLSNGITVFLYKIENNTYSIVTHTTCSSNGSFAFFNLSAANYIVEACITDENKYDPLMNTYFDQSTTWTKAEPLEIDEHEHQYIEMVMLEKTLLEKGIYTISGVLVKKTGTSTQAGMIEKNNHTATDGKPVEDANIILKLEGQIVATTTSHANGQYNLSNLPANSYQLEVMIPGYRQSEDVEVTTGENSSNNEFMNFTVWEGTNQITNTNILSYSSTVTIFPNPSNGYFIIQQPPPTSRPYNLLIYSDTGLLVYQQKNIKENPYYIDMSKAPSGIYLIKVRSGKNEVNKKLILE